VQPGDLVTVNQIIVEIETAKAAVELPSPFAGVVTELLADEGDTVDVGTPIVTVDVDPEGPLGVPAAMQAQTLSGSDMVPVLPGEQAAGTGLIGARRRAAGPRCWWATDRSRSRQAPSAQGRHQRPAGPAGRGPSPSAGPSGVTALAPAAPAPAAPVEAAQAVRAVESGRPEPVLRPAASNGAASLGAATVDGRGVSVLAKPPVRKLAKDLGVDLASVAGSGPGRRDHPRRRRGGRSSGGPA
jgi:pyruvate dehydrogenase E2 component (dihydrolipoamide acetyltransferase)